MKLLFDQNISYRIVNKITAYFTDSIHVSSIGLSDSEDIDIWQFARREGFVIVTFDSDYYDISLINGCPPKVLWLRTGNLSTNEIKAILIQNVEFIRDFAENKDNNDKACLEIS